VIPLDGVCPCTNREEINIKGEKFLSCHYNFICHKNEHCYFLDFEKCLDDLYSFKQYPLYSYPVCINEIDYSHPPTTYENRVNATYE